MKRMKHLFLLAFAVILALLMTACEFNVVIPGVTDGTHTCNFSTRVESVSSTCSEAGSETYRCICGKTKTDPLPLLDHTIEISEAREVTCTEDGLTEGTHCAVCMIVIEPQTVITAEGHTVVTDPATPADGSIPAKSEGSHCSSCGLVFVKQEFVFSDDFSTPESYDGTYGLEYLSTLEKAESFIELYNDIDAESDYFHSSGLDLLSDDYIFAEISFQDLGITSSEALAVWSAYRADHPLYYWMSTGVSYTDDTIYLISDAAYASGEARTRYNSEIYSIAERFVGEVRGNSIYTTALTFHDLIISAGDYAYDENGNPSEDVTAHSIIGILINGFGVCESYAKSFQLLLNYCNIENVFVKGYAGEPHAWNLIKLDDGKWYWCDLTWDDEPDFMWGISYRYFCVTDTEDLTGQDGPWIASTEPFIESHVPDAPVSEGINAAYPIPERSESEFEGADMMLRDTFEFEGNVYALVGYRSVALVKINTPGIVYVPNAVTNDGAEYNVIAIGRLSDGCFRVGSVAYDYENSENGLTEVTELHIDNSVIFIWDGALNIDTLTHINVSEDNEYFASLDGVLFTRDFKTLIKYPSGKTEKAYTVPSMTEYVAADAFSSFYGNLTIKLETLTLGESVIFVGIANYGYGYDHDYLENGVYEANEIATIRSNLSGEAKVYNFDGTEAND